MDWGLENTLEVEKSRYEEDLFFKNADNNQLIEWATKKSVPSNQSFFDYYDTNKFETYLKFLSEALKKRSFLLETESPSEYDIFVISLGLFTEPFLKYHKEDLIKKHEVVLLGSDKEKLFKVQKSIFDDLSFFRGYIKNHKQFPTEATRKIISDFYRKEIDVYIGSIKSIKDIYLLAITIREFIDSIKSIPDLLKEDIELKLEKLLNKMTINKQALSKDAENYIFIKSKEEFIKILESMPVFLQ